MCFVVFHRYYEPMAWLKNSQASQIRPTPHPGAALLHQAWRVGNGIWNDPNRGHLEIHNKLKGTTDFRFFFGRYLLIFLVLRCVNHLILGLNFDSYPSSPSHADPQTVVGGDRNCFSHLVENGIPRSWIVIITRWCPSSLTLSWGSHNSNFHYGLW